MHKYRKELLFPCPENLGTKDSATEKQKRKKENQMNSFKQKKTDLPGLYSYLCHMLPL